MRVICSDGSGAGYSYTIGTGGSSVLALLRDHWRHGCSGSDPAQIEAIWRDLLFATHATSVGAITSLALAAVDTALWDWRCRRDGQPLWLAAGGAKQRIPVYTTEGGWLHLSLDGAGERDPRGTSRRLQGRQVQGRQAASERGRGAAARRARSSGRRLRADGRRQRVFHARARRCAVRRTMPRWTSPGSRSPAGRRHQRPPTAGRGQRGADRGRRIPVFDRPVRRLRAAGRGVDPAGRRGAYRRHHAMAQGGAFGRSLQPHRAGRLPDGAARVAVCGGAERGGGSSTSRSSMPLPTAGWSSRTAMPRHPTRRDWASPGAGTKSRRARVPRIAWLVRLRPAAEVRAFRTSA